MNKLCVVSKTDKCLVFKEQRSVFRIENPNKRSITCYEVDGCLVNEGLRCDWLLVDDESRQEVYVELKGCDVDRAVAQICSTVDALSAGSAVKKKGYVICTRSPLSSPAIQKLQKKVMASHKLSLRIRKTTHEEAIDKVLA